jgi:hypothetical protein
MSGMAVLRALLIICVFATASVSCAAESSKASYAGRASFQTIPDATACPPGQIAPLLVAAIPILVEQGLDFLQKMAAANAAAYETSVSATMADDFLINCHTPAEPNMKTRLAGLRFGYGAVSGTAVGGLEAKYVALGFTEKPKFYMEGGFVFSGNNRYMRFVPTVLEFNAPMAAKGTDKDLLVTLSFSFPSAWSPSGKSAGNNLTGSGQPPTDGPHALASSTSATNKDSKKDASPNTDKSDNSANSGKSDKGASPEGANPTSGGSTQSVVLPLFEHMVQGRAINLNTVTSGWIAVPAENPATVVLSGKTTLPVSVTVVAKETDAGNGAAIWLAVSGAISSNSSAIGSAISGALGGAKSSGTQK